MGSSLHLSLRFRLPRPVSQVPVKQAPFISCVIIKSLYSSLSVFSPPVSSGAGQAGPQGGLGGAAGMWGQSPQGPSGAPAPAAAPGGWGNNGALGAAAAGPGGQWGAPSAANGTPGQMNNGQWGAQQTNGQWGQQQTNGQWPGGQQTSNPAEPGALILPFSLSFSLSYVSLFSYFLNERSVIVSVRVRVRLYRKYN